MRRDVRTHALWLATAAALITFTAVETPRAQAPAPAQAPLTGVDLVRARYTKYEHLIPMRDGARLFSAVYVRKDISQSYPMLLTRTPYSVAPYGVDKYREALGPSEHFEKEGFIFVYQDARGRHMSEGEFQQVRPLAATRPEGYRREHGHLRHDRVALDPCAEPQRARRHVGHVAARLPRRGRHDRLTSGAQGRLAAGADRRLLHGRRRLSQRGIHARGELRLLLGVPPAHRRPQPPKPR